jgi:hypothetical protein
MKKIVLLATFALAFVLGACGPMPARPSNFPTGRLQQEGNEIRALQFNKDGTFRALAGDLRLAAGTYSVKGDVYTEESNDQSCPTSKHYKYTFAGGRLVFRPVEDPATDPCDGRKGDFNEKVTWVLAK